MHQGFIERKVHDRVLELLKLWEKIANNERDLSQADKEREKIYRTQEQIRGNMGALAQTGEEGKMRARYIGQLEATEEQLKGLAQHESALRAEIEQLRQEAERLAKTPGQ